MKLILALLLSGCMASAQTLVQQGGNNATTAGTTLVQSAAFTTVAAGDLLVVFGGSGNASTHSAPTDTAGDTFTQCTGSPQTTGGGAVRGSCWFKCNTAGGSTFSVTFNSTSDVERSMVVLDYSGISTGTCQDTGAGATSGATGTPSVTIVPGASGRLIVAGMVPNSAIGVYTAGTNYTKQREEPSSGDFTTHEPVFVEDRLSAPSGSQTATGGSSVTSGWAMVGEAFIPSGATPSGSMLGGPGMWGGPSQVQ